LRRYEWSNKVLEQREMKAIDATPEASQVIKRQITSPPPQQTKSDTEGSKIKARLAPGPRGFAQVREDSWKAQL
jgi:hypothetical protein